MSNCPYCDYSPLPAGVAACPQCRSRLRDDAPVQAVHQATRPERIPPDAVEQRVKTMKEAALKTAAPPTPVLRPQLRPPMAMICIVDDGREAGEWIRIRGAQTVIGRTEGEIQIPHDSAISSRHAEIRRVEEAGVWKWFLRDLGSTNGSFIRVNVARLHHNLEFLVAYRRLRFEMPGSPPAASEPTDGPAPQHMATQGWQVMPRRAPAAAVVDLQADGSARYELSSDEHWIGSDPSCTVPLPDDPFISPRHAKIACDARGQWSIESVKPSAGTWVRLESVPIDTGAEFLMGEQRFLFKVL